MVEGASECIVSRPMAFILRMSSLCGCAAMNLEPLGPRYYIARLSKLKFYFSSTIILLLNLTAVVAHFIKFKELNIFAGKNLLLFGGAITKILITTVAATDNLGRMKRLIQYLNSIKQVHTKLNEIWKKMFYDRTSRYNYENVFGTLMIFFICLYGGWFMVLSLYLFMANFGKSASVIYAYIVLSFQQLYITIVEAQTLLVISTAYSALQEFTRALAEFHSIFDATDNFKYSRSWKQFEIFNELRDSYVSILDTVRNIRRKEGGVLLMILFHIYINVVLLGYFISLLVSEEVVYNIKLRLLELTTSWTLLVINLALTIDPCHRTQQVVKEIKGIVGSLICKSSSSYTFSTDLKIFCKQLLFQPAAYTVLNICNLDRSLIITILTAITTSVVTLLRV